MSATTQFFCRQPKSIDLIQDYEEIQSFVKPTAECRSAIYSGNGAFFAYTQPTEVVIVKCDNQAEVFYKLELPEVFDLEFSHNGTYLCVWCKPINLDRESGVWNKNVKIFNLNTKSIIMEWSAKHQNGWKPQFTQDEKLFAKGQGNSKEIEFYDISDSTNLMHVTSPKFRYKTEAPYNAFKISPGLNPSIAVFIPEKSGKPANVSIYNLPNFNQAVCSKNFFKAEKCQLKWNSLGTALLALASTDHDTTNQSYYGETNLYLLGIAGSYNSRIDLKKEGPIHDITWSPSAREFAVIYGYMPSETSFFDARGNLIYSLPTLPRNTILYSPHAKYILVAGFGNLQGTVDIYDRQDKFKKVVSFEATNTSVCEWSPCGRFILTATTAPRLRVDNGCKVWHYSGKLVYYREYNELFAINWKPQSLDQFPQIKAGEPCPEPQQSAKDYLLKKQQAQGPSDVKKPIGAYRPPHARNGNESTTRTTLYQKELENNLNGTGATFAPKPRVRTVPGAPPPVVKESKTTVKNRKKKEAAQKNQEEKPTSAANTPSASPPPSAPAANNQVETGAVLGGVSSVEEKKIRSLLKKLRAIETLKMKQAYGEPLEETQVSKIEKEDSIRKELETLGWSE